MSIPHNRIPSSSGVHDQNLSHNFSANFQTIISRLSNARRTGKGYMARCPAHQDRSSSLSICCTNDGTILLKCFAGCGAGEVVSALGLTLGDLFPVKPKDCTPEGRSQLRQFARESDWGAALNVLGFEAGVMLLAGADLLAGKHTAENQTRLGLACERITSARQVLL